MSSTTSVAALRAETPEQVIGLFASSLEAGDLERALTLFEPNAVLVPRPGERVTGLDAIRAALSGFFALEARMTSDIQNVLEADGVAVIFNRWTLEGAQPDGTPVRLEAMSADVVRRQPDGRWLLLIDDPWGV